MEGRGPNPLLKGTWGLLREERTHEGARRHPVMSNTVLLLASSWAVLLSARNVFARMATGRGDTQPCPWNFGPLSRTGGLQLYKRTCSFQIQACKHTPGDCLFFPEGGVLSPHPANSASQLAGKGLLGGPFSGAVSSETGAVGRGPTLTGKGRATSTRLFRHLCSEKSSSEPRTVRKSLGSYKDTPCV